MTVIGLGAMGSTMARTYVAAGHPTTVWNRTPGKADGLGAVPATTAADAVAAGTVVVISQVDYPAMFDSLADADLRGRVLVNLSSDSPERLREAAAWVAERGGTLVTGGIMVPPPGIGKPGAYAFYAGPVEAIEAHRAALEVLGRVDHVGTDPGLAMLYYQAMLNIFWTTLISYFYSAALVGNAEHLRPYVATMLTDLTQDGPMGFLRILTRELESGEYPGADNNLHMQAVGAEHVVQAFTDAGLDVTVPSAVAELFARADAAGFGGNGLSALAEMVRKP
ncbi:3-hydroxyisobutyrate dehydrogenase-like beta-hydroxyacid dehydrogenase [Kribbella jejuensis]|uniref:3-hydroxyisobutyrate dehydrogenase-like beta-hydroxyacid dehydrogenase n=1 Tax=Kribbella jejuensis TaxID=236068 RepID=A0A542EUM9_9ACTN|nr:3-hydroxyisobutyrate dehydrogenase-like beta-hydroxyacid dehydrogenase [Kribbella jejuensis]